MRALVVAAAVLGLSGCLMSAFVNRPAVTAEAGELRSRRGVCAARVVGEGAFTSGTVVSACAQVGSPGTLDDDGKTPVLVSTFSDDSWSLADPGSWQLEVFDAAGAVLLKQRLEKRVPSVGVCTSKGCRKDGLDLVRFEPGWKPGTYRIRYTCSFDTSIVAELTITLT